MKSILRNAFALSAAAIATQAAAQVTFYEHQSFQGQSFTTEQHLGNLERYGFNNRASSVVVRGEPWQVCDGAGFSGRCVVLRPGEYGTLGTMGLNDTISSVRPVNRDARSDDNRNAPPRAGQVAPLLQLLGGSAALATTLSAEGPAWPTLLADALYEVTGRKLGLAFAEGDGPAEQPAEDEGPAGEEKILELVKDTLDARERDDA